MGKLFLFVTLTALFAFAVSTDDVRVHTAVDEAKLSAFTKIGDHYYTFGFELAHTWFDAAHACRRMDAQLATIGTEKEWHDLATYMSANGYTQRFWFSGNNLDTKKEFYLLSTGQKMDFLKWGPGQPSNSGGNENCLEMLIQGSQYLMNDAPCDFKFGYICEAPSPKTVTITIW